jgi:hypothetical protein
MTLSHPRYNEYATCYRCGLKKYCKNEGKMTICYACSNGNYNGLKTINKDNRL